MSFSLPLPLFLVLMLKWSGRRQCCLSKSNIMMWANRPRQLPRQNWQQHFCFRFPRKFNSTEISFNKSTSEHWNREWRYFHNSFCILHCERWPRSDKKWLILIIGGQFRNFIKGGRDVYGWLGVKIPGNWGVIEPATVISRHFPL